jgi:hypothetical protein
MLPELREPRLVLNEFALLSLKNKKANGLFVKNQTGNIILLPASAV